MPGPGVALSRATPCIKHPSWQLASKRGGIRVTLVEGLASSSAAEPDMLDLDDALTELARLDERRAHLVDDPQSGVA